ncbi:MAG: hypothetical protein NC548_38900 [Lachnospiraceae bacterium]|nr:hypothetical protein [Lachnospiraceae bacterium]
MQNNFKEIERKWIINRLPTGFDMVASGTVQQAYLSIDPEVRIRRSEIKGKPVAHFITIKSNGDLSRDEVNIKISKEQYDAILAMIGIEPIVKDFHKYSIGFDLMLECSHIDAGGPNELFYAEVEFPSEKSANEFKTLDIFDQEVTNDSSYKMKNYWVRTRLASENKDTVEKDNMKNPEKTWNDINIPDPVKDFIKNTLGGGKDINVIKVDPNGTPEQFTIRGEGNPDQSGQCENHMCKMMHTSLEGIDLIIDMLKTLMENVSDLDKDDIEEIVYKVVRKECNRVINANYGGSVKAERIAPYMAELRSAECVDKDELDKRIKKRTKKIMKSKKFKKFIKNIVNQVIREKELVDEDDLEDLSERVDDIDSAVDEINGDVTTLMQEHIKNKGKQEQDKDGKEDKKD